MSAMNTPPRKLLKVLNSSSAIRPGTIRTARSAPDTSMNCRIILVRLGCSSAMWMLRRWTNATAVSTIAMARAAPMPSRPMARPLNTEVIANATPFTVPTSPFALSRSSSGTRRVTVVASATERRLPAMAPARINVTRAQNAR